MGTRKYWIERLLVTVDFWLSEDFFRATADSEDRC